ncbi:cellulase family glycosylhydrolase [Motilimonas cestriensis]|uniref:Cellulase family glycosylhydrolase n=2 Tax=Motilimonas cestriensis TaxID=2742685 RepID=A0ABS8W952_9GAMM|nr:cellulase family glycosylhydrolase [Motilimonas cestriensis]
MTFSQPVLAVDCSGIEAYQGKGEYTQDQQVTHQSNKFQCTVPGWCALDGPYEPGVGWASSNAWQDLGVCDTGGGDTGGGDTGGGDTGGGDTGGGDTGGGDTGGGDTGGGDTGGGDTGGGDTGGGDTGGDTGGGTDTTGPSCDATEDWQASVAYGSGTVIDHQGELYQANWWTKGADPLKNSGPWQVWSSQGSCSTSGGDTGGDTGGGDTGGGDTGGGDTGGGDTGGGDTGGGDTGGDTGGNTTDTPVALNGQLSVCGTKLCNEKQQPVQLQGMSSHGLQWYGWNNCLTEKSLDALAKDWQADVLRISLYVQEGGYETDPQGYTEQVNRLIAEASERGMYALVDWHQLDPGDPNYNLANAKRFFTDIANANKDRNNIIYDIANEPNKVSWDRIQSYSTEIIPVIRAIDPDAVVLVGTHGWASLGVSDGASYQDIVKNPVPFDNVMYTFHFYAASHDDYYRQQLTAASEVLPLFVTEFGTQTYTGDGNNDFVSAQAYLDILNSKQISWVNWNYSDDFRSGAVWQQSTCRNDGPWAEASLKPAGKWVREQMRK